MQKYVNGVLTDLTSEEINQRAVDKVQTEAWFAEFGYALKRKEEYPPAADYLDGIVKGDTVQVNAYIAACLAVKAKYPKGDQ